MDARRVLQSIARNIKSWHRCEEIHSELDVLGFRKENVRVPARFALIEGKWFMIEVTECTILEVKGRKVG